MSEIYYYYSIRSDFAYMGAHRIVALAKKFNAKLIHRPIKLSVILGPIGASLDDRPPLRGAYSQLDGRRWAQFLGMEKHDDPIHHDGPMELPSGIVIAAQRWVERGEKGDHHELHRLILEALWRYDRDIADPRLIAELAEQAGFDASKLVRDALSELTQAELARNCREAITKGVMGSPSYFVDGENFYGQDRLDFVERKLQGKA